MKHHTKNKGDLAVAKVIADLSEKGFDVLLPLSEHLPFDLVAYKNDVFYRVQVKYSSVKKGAVVVKLTSSWTDKKGTHIKHINKNVVDFHAIYSPETNKCFYLDTKKFGNTTSIALKVGVSKNNQVININLADDYINPPV